MTRRDLLATSAATALASALPPPAADRAPVVNCAEHVWVVRDPRFPIRRELATCPRELVEYDYSGEYLISEMKRYNHNHTVISHVCYYGRDNSYTIHCVKTWPKWFTGYGLMVGYGLYPPGDKENPSRLRRLMKDDGLIGLRISPRYDPKVVWFNDPVMYPMWKEAQELGAVFHIFLSPHQIGQVADMAERYPGVTIVIDHMAMIDIKAPDSEGVALRKLMTRMPSVISVKHRTCRRPPSMPSAT